MKLAGKTNVGRVRRENQDDFRGGDISAASAWGLVCDGMGGARGGREASRMACDKIEQRFQEGVAQCRPGDEAAFLTTALRDASRTVYDRSVREAALSGMGTTAVCALIRGRQLHLCHAGDSRAYLLHGDTLTQLTHDHSYVQELVDCGTITEQEAENHPQKNIITRALGVEPRLEPEYTAATMAENDILLLCSDGVSNMVPAAKMKAILRGTNFYDIPDHLIDAANAGGGQDNSTVLLMALENTEGKNGSTDR